MDNIIKLWNSGEIPLFNKDIEQPEPYLIPYICEGAKTCVLICPGGGYGMLTEHEGTRFGPWFNSMGISAFVLNYRIAPYKFPCPQLDVQRAMRVVRSLSEKYGYNSNQIGIMGSSAGGHAACSAGIMHGSFGYETDEIDKISARPDFMLLCYSVMDMGEYAHQGSRDKLLGENASEADVKLMTLFDKVNENTPPVFMWHTANDNKVPVENSLLMAMSLSKHKVPFALHCFEKGIHGLGLSEDNADVAQWKALFINWMKNRGLL